MRQNKFETIAYNILNLISLLVKNSLDSLEVRINSYLKLQEKKNGKATYEKIKPVKLRPSLKKDFLLFI